MSCSTLDILNLFQLVSLPIQPEMLSHKLSAWLAEENSIYMRVMCIVGSFFFLHRKVSVIKGMVHSAVMESSKYLRTYKTLNPDALIST